MAIIKGTAFDDVLASGAGLDTITGVGGNDVLLIGDPVADHPLGEMIDGGAGFDRLWFTSALGGDTLVLRAGVKGIERVEIANAAGDASGALALNVDASALAAIATGFTLNGNAGANILTGTKGNDLITGGAGADTIVGGLGNDRIFMSVTSVDQIDAGNLPTEINTLMLSGAATGVAMINLGAGPNLDQLTAFGGAAEALVQSDFNNVDASAMTANGVNVTASLAKNVLAGGVANDVFVYVAPTHITGDVVSGGGGSDAVHFASTIAGQTLLLGAAVNVERALIADAAGVITGTDAVNLSAAAARAIELVGNDGINKLTGSAFADTMNGNGGADSLAGGAGNDIFVADSGADWVALDKISDSAGTDDRIAFTAVAPGDTLVLGVGIAGIESVWTTDTAFNVAGATALHVDGSALLVAMSFVGNAGANQLTGGKGNDTFTGNDGTDTLNGGAGADLVIMDVEDADQADGGNATALEANTLKLDGNAVAALEFDLTVAADADQSATLGQVQADFTHIDATDLGGDGVVVTLSTQFNQITGSDQDDVFVVNSQAHLGIDKIDGLDAAADGGDRLRFAAVALSQLTLSTNVKSVEIFEIADAAGDTSGLVGHGINAAAMTYAVSLVGNSGANMLTGTKFGDTLNGGAGADTLVGGLEADTYQYDVSGDFAVGEKITDAGGSDTIKFVSTAGGDVLVVAGVTGIEFYELEAEDLSGTGFDLSALAATAAANISGNDGGNLLTGTKGNDTIRGNKGDDTIDGGLGADSIEGGEGVDSILGGAGADLLVVDVDEMDSFDLGAVVEKNTLYLTGAGVEAIDLGSLVDQVAGAGVQLGIHSLDASRMDPGTDPEDLGVFVIGRDTQPGGGDFIVGSPRNDEFHPGLGADTIEGGGGHDVWYVFSIAEFTGDVYNDSGGTLRDYLFFDIGGPGTITVQDFQVNGVDVGSAGFGPADTTNININVSAMNESFSMAGNAGKNVLTGTRFGETIFDWGGADNMMGGDGSDTYVIIVDWVYDLPGVPGDRINDTNGFDDLYNATDVVLVVDRDHIKGIERFVVSDADVPIDPQPGSYSRNILVTNPGGIDASDLLYGIHLAGNYGDNLLIGGAAGDTIFGYAGNDTIEGRGGNDDIYMDVGELDGLFGDPDMIDAGLGSDRLFLRGAPTGDVVVDLMLADQVESINNLAETLIQTGFENYVDASQMERPSDDTIPPTANFGVQLKGRNTGKDTLIGTNDDDLFVGRDGADLLIGNSGDDTFVVLSLTDVDAGELMLGGAGEDTLRFASVTDGQVLTLSMTSAQDIEAVVLGDEIGGLTTGTTALNVNAAAMMNAMKLVGNDGANLLTGTAFADTLIGNGGADTLKGGAGNDFYEIEAGTHVVALDRIEDTGGVDTVRFTSSTDGDAVVLLGVMTGIEEMQIWDGAEDLVGNLHLALDATAVTGPLNLTGSKFNNTITGGAGNDTIDGLLGNDSINGGGGADRIISSLEDDTADDVDGGAATSEGNLLILSGELTLAMAWDLTNVTDQLISVHGAGDRVFRDITSLDLTLLTGDFGVTITGTPDANTLLTGNFDDLFISATPFVAGERITAREGMDELRFTSITPGQVMLLSAQITGLEKVLISDALGDTSGLTALSVNAAAVADALYLGGNAGNNSLTGTGKADTIVGGGGVDTIVGGGGADEIRFTADTALSQAVGGALSEGNRLFIDGTLATALTVNLMLASGDQITGVGDTATQSGFAHLDASGMSAASVVVTGSALGNLIKGTPGADSIFGGLGADTIGVHVDGGDDTVTGGLLTEGNELVLLGAGGATVDLAQLVDQVTSLGGNQGGFMHLDASAMTGAGVNVTGSAAGNRIVGTALADTIDGGLGADTISWDVGSAPDDLDGGNLGDGDLLVVTGVATATVGFNLLTVPEADQITGAGVASDFQHIDASKLEDFGINARGNGLNNKLTGTVKSDTLIGMGGADTFVLGGGVAGDDMTDHLIYEVRSDGANSLAAPYGFDRIKDFDVGIDEIRFVGGEFNTPGGAFNLDDIATDNNVFSFASDVKADFSATHEALYISANKSKLVGEAPLTALATAIGAINTVGVIAAAGDDGLIVLQSNTRAGFYYYQESDGIANAVSATELILLGIVEAQANKDDFAFG